MNSCRKDQIPPIVKDIDGNVYRTIVVGGQVWMAENLKTTKFSDGSNISLVPGFTAWLRLTTPGYCWFDNNPELYKTGYGALYNWHTVNTGKLCPKGWHVPDDEEWNTLIEYLGGLDIAGGSLKEEGTGHWYNPNIGATNESGFSAIPGGARGVDGTFILLGKLCAFWSSTMHDTWSAQSINIESSNARVKDIAYGVTNGMSIRCIMNSN